MTARSPRELSQLALDQLSDEATLGELFDRFVFLTEMEHGFPDEPLPDSVLRMELTISIDDGDEE